MSRKFESSFAGLETYLKALEAREELEPGQMEASVKAVKRMKHAVRIDDRQAFEAAVNDFARVFLRLRPEP